jgi:hypothetical protein
MPLNIRPGFLIDVVQYTKPSIPCRLLDRAGLPKDIGGAGVLRLIVKTDPTLGDAFALFDITPAVTSSSQGLFTIPFVTANLVRPGRWSAQLRHFLAPPAPGDVPDDAYEGTISILTALRKVEP